MVELATSASYETEVAVMAVVMFIAVVAKEDVVGGSMVKTYMNFPKGTEQSWKKLVYTLYTNGYSYPHSKIIIFKK